MITGERGSGKWVIGKLLGIGIQSLWMKRKGEGSRVREKVIDLKEEDLIVYCLATQDEFCKQIVPICERKLFKDDNHGVIASWLCEYYKESRQAPKSSNNFQSLFALYARGMRNERKDELWECLKVIDKKFRKDEALDEALCIQRASLYLQLERYKQFADDFYNCYETRDLIRAQDILLTARALQENKTAAHRYPHKETLRYVEHRDAEKQELFTIKPALVGQVFGRIYRSDFVSIIAPMKRGKSSFLLWLGVQAQDCGCKVAYYNLEMDDDYVDSRYHNLVVGDTTQEDIKYSVFVEDKLDEGKYRVKVKTKPGKRMTVEEIDKIKKKRRLYAKGTFMFFSPPSLSIRGLQDDLARLQEYENYVPDVVIIDHADLMIPDGRDDRRIQISNLWRALRRIAREKNIAIITASQTNREALEGDIKRKHINDSVDKLGEVTSLVALNQTSEEEKNCTMRLSCLEVRRGRKFMESVTVTQSLDLAQPALDARYTKDVIVPEVKVPVTRRK
jgi:hypothetical protein